MSKKLYIKTWGCQMNVYDSQKMADVLSTLGYEQTPEPEGADLMILNTCHIREKATEKVFSDLGRLRDHKEAKEEKGEKALIAVAGCVAQAEGDVILSRAKYVDMVFGPQTYHLLPEMILNAAGGARVVNTDFPVESKFDHLPVEAQAQGPSAMLSVQEGCDKFCTFCVVPYTRGAEFSRPVQQVLDEAQRMVDGGAKEITLLGQNVNAYHGDGPNGETWDLARLIGKLADMNGLQRIRYMTSHPKDMNDNLIAAHGEVAKLMPFLHLPLQSGSDRVLELMNRKHKASDYLDIIARVKKARPDIALSSDFIVGFPGETDEDHKQTIDIVQQVGFAACYSFKYSPRPGTPGAAMGGIVPESVKDARLHELQALLFAQQHEYNRRSVGKTMPVLFDRRGEKTGQLQGKSPWMQSVYVNAPERLFGEILDVTVEKAFQNGMYGTIVTIPDSNPSEKREAA
ncbi:MAG: tRNA (N6-isopentenyl adenosine(37)-C2)-methylthiotransferase MiaB [Alphaproteobacteria bacterium]|nr:MAG: tRNA (N6-isopentenyl adenosine(37)-C2)-methylthiotransferase MiaB [Alphaproteobacteria bacterium]